MLKKIFAALVVGVIVMIVVISLQPSDFRVARRATLPAPPAVVFDQVNNLQKWESWSPWAKLDPNAKNTFAGPEAGVGASMSWSGNDQVGEGTMTIEESLPVDHLRFRIDFRKPFEATNAAEFTFKPAADGRTDVTWTMTGTNNFIGKAIGLFMDCDKMVGGQFETGLTQLGVASESAAKQ